MFDLQAPSVGGYQMNTGTYFGNGYENMSPNGGSAYKQNLSSIKVDQMIRNTQASFFGDFEIINAYFQQGKTDEALELYHSLFDEVKRSNSVDGRYELNDSQVKSILNESYAAATGNTVVQAIDSTTSSPFWTGIKASIPILGMFENKTSDSEALAHLSGREESTKDKVKETTGTLLGCTANVVAGCYAFGIPFVGPFISVAMIGGSILSTITSFFK